MQVPSLQCHSTEKSNILTNNYHLNSYIAIILLALSQKSAKNICNQLLQSYKNIFFM